MEKNFINYLEFFEKCGDHYVHPTKYGENYFPISMEELYQHFKQRFLEEEFIKE